MAINEVQSSDIMVHINGASSEERDIEVRQTLSDMCCEVDSIFLKVVPKKTRKQILILKK